MLYAKIDLSSIGGTSLHLFNLHPQASYFRLDPSLYAETFVCRYDQIKEVRDFAYEKVFDNAVNYNPDGDIVMILGDFNMNCGKLG